LLHVAWSASPEHCELSLGWNCNPQLWCLAQRSREHNGILSDLENRLQALKMERIAAENEMQLIQVDGAGQVRMSEARGEVQDVGCRVQGLGDEEYMYF
jgi:hypothetical protein